MADAKRLICDSQALRDGGNGVRFTVHVGGVAQPAFAIRYDGCVHAYLNRCAHVPVEMDWQEGQFFDADGSFLQCATHGALYAPETGECLAGPCHGRHLTPVKVIEEDGQVFLMPAPGSQG